MSQFGLWSKRVDGEVGALIVGHELREPFVVDTSVVFIRSSIFTKFLNEPKVLAPDLALEWSLDRTPEREQIVIKIWVN